MMDFTYNEKDNTLYLNGIIQKGDCATLERILNRLDIGYGIKVRLNSKGGSIHEAGNIGNLLISKYCSCKVEGNCHSAAFIILMLCQERYAYSNSTFGFHFPEYEDNPEKVILEQRIQLIFNMLTIHTPVNFENWYHLMEQNQTINAQKAKELGFILEIFEHSTEPSKA